MPQPGSYRHSSECLAVCGSCERCLGEPICKKKNWCFVETIGTNITGVVVAVGKDRFAQAATWFCELVDQHFTAVYAESQQKHERYDFAETLSAR